MYNRNKHEYCISNAWKNGNNVLQEPIFKKIAEEVGVRSDHSVDSVIRNCVTIFKLIVFIVIIIRDHT